VLLAVVLGVTCRRRPGAESVAPPSPAPRAPDAAVVTGRFVVPEGSR
jgi:hypothetical protein